MNTDEVKKQMPFSRSNTIDEENMSDEPTPQITPSFEAKERSSSSFITEQSNEHVNQSSQPIITIEDLKLKIAEALKIKQSEIEEEQANQRLIAEENLNKEIEAR